MFRNADKQRVYRYIIFEVMFEIRVILRNADKIRVLTCHLNAF